MTKEQFIEQIQRRLGGGEVTDDVRGKYPYEVVAGIVEMAYNSMLWGLVKGSQATKDFSPLNGLTKSFVITAILNDSVRDQFYIDLPVSIAQLPNNEAIRSFRPAKQGSGEYIYRDPSSISVFDGLDVNLVDQGIRYSPEHDKIYFLNMEDNTKPKNLLLQIACTFDAYDDGDEIHIPAEQDAVVFGSVLDLIQGKAEDVVNDTTLQ